MWEKLKGCNVTGANYWGDYTTVKPFRVLSLSNIHMLTLSNVGGLNYKATNLSRFAHFEPETYLHWGFSIKVVLGQNTRNFQTNWLKSYCASGEVYGGFKGINTIFWIF